MTTPKNLVWETTSGTASPYTLNTVARSFDDAFGTGGTDVFTAFMYNRDAPGEWMVCTGHLSDASTLVVDTVIEGANGTSEVAWSAGTKDVINDIPAPDQIIRSDVREKLIANRDYYVRTDGNDTNDGLSDTSGGAFLTIQKAIDTAVALDLSIYAVTIHVGAGTWTAAIELKPYIGVGPITLQGDTSTPANVTISLTSASCITASGVRSKWIVTGFKFTTATSGYGLSLTNSVVDIGVVEYGTCATGGVTAEQGSIVTFLNNYTISGGGTRHWFPTTMGLIQCVNKTITITGTPAFSTAFLVGSRGGGVMCGGNTYSGSATGSRYILSTNAWVDSAAGTLPGNSAGSTSTGGQYL